jgi:hypothetical protein
MGLPFRASATFARQVVAVLLKAQLTESEQVVSIFMSVEEPSMALDAYVLRLCERLGLTEESLSVALLYIDNFLARGRRALLSPLSVHRILLTAVALALLWLEDEPLPWNGVARAGGVPLYELGEMMRLFLVEIAWSLFVRPEAVQMVRQVVHGTALA